ncbi:MAG: universal stress protein [Rhodospirillaceae bacterium]|nr:universal stress protein [Rhodospirillaceae bacterium]
MPLTFLCPTDGSKLAQKAVAYAIQRAAKDGASLTVLHVETLTPERAARTHFWDQTILDAADIQDHKILGAAAAAARRAGFRAATYVTVAGRDVAAAIAAFARKNRVDHIIMGSHGRRGVAQLILGSVANGVAARAGCPVTIVR